MSEKSKNISLWKSLDGRETRVCDLENTHLINVIRHVLKRISKLEMKPPIWVSTFSHGVSGMFFDTNALLREQELQEQQIEAQRRHEQKVLHELTDEALHRGYTLDEIVSSIPVYTLSKDDQQHLSVYADHFEDVGNMNLANLLRSIIEDSKKHAVRKWSSKKEKRHAAHNLCTTCYNKQYKKT